MPKINDLRNHLTTRKTMSGAQFARATGWIKDEVCEGVGEALERFCELNPTMTSEEAIRQMREAL